ncbi:MULTISPECIES: AraC family transcriptional regulator [Xanthobacteraceae]|uniref:AraC-like DNA-binding protein n=1 Tax=Labrys monachus TaxID=217067 RepID=A0ABU0FGA3_9HYPH|nr:MULTISPECIES: AraC family transcriptional regulator [Xanthobacteraceae]MBS7538212.1 helix-turn-helix domain-containing protein [Ancylobacter lacus]MDQ0393496.1 AraC-like DNA-binding protein [Labrys monachus]
MDGPTIEIRSYADASRRHDHDHHQIVLPFRGCLELDFGHSGGYVATGVGAIIPAGADHAFQARGNNAFVVMDLPDEYPVQTGIFGSVGAFFAIGADLQGLLDYATVRSSQSNLPTHLRAAWTSLMLDRLNATASHPDFVDVALRRAISFMRERLADPVRTDDIAAAAGLSLTRLHAAFRDRLGSTPHAHLSALRLDAAERLLMTTSDPIAIIALRTGHADQSALTRALKRERGKTPAAMRRAVRHGNSADEA